MTLNYLRQAFYFFKNNLFALAAIQLPFLVLAELIRLMLLPQGDVDLSSSMIQKNLLLSTVLSLLLQPFYRAATIAYLESVVHDAPISTTRAYLFGIANWGRVFITSLLTGIMTSLGFLLFVLPGIYVAVRLAFADLTCVLDRRSPFDSIGKSWENTDQYFWTILGGGAILMIGLTFAQQIILALVGHVVGLSTFIDLAFAFCSTLLTIFRFRIFCVMRGQ